MFDFHLTSIQFIRIYARTCTKKRAKVQKKMHKYKKNRRKFTFSAVFLVFGLRRVAVASRWDCPGNVGALEGTTMPLYVRTKSASAA